jgi:two-component system chemotaxis response regulator CheY
MPVSILIADSSSAMRAVIERAIDLAGLPVSDCHQAADAQEVLRLIESRPIDFVLLDTHLNGMEEQKLVATLSTAREGAAIPFLATSADASSPRIERLLGAGACDYLLKPFSISTFCARLETALRTVHAKN